MKRHYVEIKFESIGIWLADNYLDVKLYSAHAVWVFIHKLLWKSPTQRGAAYVWPVGHPGCLRSVNLSHGITASLLAACFRVMTLSTWAVHKLIRFQPAHLLWRGEIPVPQSVLVRPRRVWPQGTQKVPLSIGCLIWCQMQSWRLGLAVYLFFSVALCCGRRVRLNSISSQLTSIRSLG